MNLAGLSIFEMLGGRVGRSPMRSRWLGASVLSHRALPSHKNEASPHAYSQQIDPQAPTGEEHG